MEQVEGHLPSNLLAFWDEHNVDRSLMSLEGKGVRYFRGPRNMSCSASELQEIGAEKAEVEGFFRVSSSVSLSKLPMYAEGRAVGLDLSSGAAVLGLDVRPQDHVLDLCCAPGMVRKSEKERRKEG